MGEAGISRLKFVIGAAKRGNGDFYGHTRPAHIHHATGRAGTVLQFKDRVASSRQLKKKDKAICTLSVAAHCGGLF
jgi:hypothetical protein